jgi:hypothetical protein
LKYYLGGNTFLSKAKAVCQKLFNSVLTITKEIMWFDDFYVVKTACNCCISKENTNATRQVSAIFTIKNLY